ncbi:16S rRNA (cytidine(1402)-2'-O)-methyltransferase [Metabacillus sp. KIGAM252]|uniref:Ribosomal RNA small subunit methyltransferase I n=1 Tax=Metabacillus flavus TaxID=2823519 RepID=A0ABS5L9E7_9BACI|nr:16S rRNA (cytidine(1402)-2'-O)-methyltransferase [Metabacillus flavus]MBS2967251.1 16S rRNA (cytidine(1402)-2'-O)-methyltransferase [Metabacillus flavus]
MRTQQSFKENTDTGILYLVPTPIGNLEDMTYRAIRILKEADLIAAEDTRQSKKLCNHFEIDTPLTSYHEHNKESSGYKIIDYLKEGITIALVSDAGMPTISDPGSELVEAALEENLTVVPLPGANAALTALIASGLTPQPFFFYGFLNRQKKEKKKELELLKPRQETIIFYESPHRLKDTLTIMEEILGNRKVVLSRELTKKFEEFVRGTLSEANEWAIANEIRGEFCLILEGASSEDAEAEEDLWWNGLSIITHIEHYIEKGISSKEAIKTVALDRGLPKREVYNEYHKEE